MIHSYKQNGYFIVLDTASGAVHSVDDVAYDMINMYENTDKEVIFNELETKYYDREDVTREDLEDCYSDILELIDAGQLFSEETYKNLAFEYKNNSKVVKALCLHIAHTCNLCCSYCFASQGKYKGTCGVMPFEVGKRAIDFLIENSGKRHNLEVDFFGGEPLLGWKVIKQVVNYARSIEKKHNKNFRFTLTTNGMLVDKDVIEFSNREMSNVVLSLDGRREVHDYFRYDIKGRGSYDTIVPLFQKFVESRGNTGYYMRGTFTHRNPDFLQDILHMADLGFTELSMEPVVCEPGDPSELTIEDMEIVKDQYEQLAIEMLKREREGRPFSFYHYILDLENGPCIYKRIAGCGSGTEYMAVTPWGELFPCHQFVGDNAYSLGNIWDGVLNKDAQDEFRCCNVYSRHECDDCWAKLYCSGGCSANAFHASGNINGIYEAGCDLFRKRIECAIMMQVAREEEGIVPLTVANEHCGDGCDYSAVCSGEGA